MFKFDMGVEVKEIITGFKGVIMGRTEYFTGCVHYGVASKKLNNDGKPINWEWFDGSRLKQIGRKKFKFNGEKDKPSGIMPTPPSCG